MTILNFNSLQFTRRVKSCYPFTNGTSGSCNEYVFKDIMMANLIQCSNYNDLEINPNPVKPRGTEQIPSVNIDTAT